MGGHDDQVELIQARVMRVVELLYEAVLTGNSTTKRLVEQIRLTYTDASVISITKMSHCSKSRE